MNINTPICTSCVQTMVYGRNVPHWSCPECGSVDAETMLSDIAVEERTLYKINKGKRLAALKEKKSNENIFQTR